MRIKDSFDDGVQVLHLHGDFDAADASAFDAHIDRAIEHQHVRVVFDCRDLGDLTSSGLVALVRARKRLQEHGGGLTFARMRPDACAAFHAVGLDRCVTCFDTVGDAISHFEEAVAPPVTLLGELAATPHDVDLEFSFVGEGQAAVVGRDPLGARLTAVNLEGVSFRPKDAALACERPWLFAHGVPLRLTFALRVDETVYPITTAAAVASLKEASCEHPLVVARFTHLLVADRVVIEMVLHSGHDRG